MFGALLLFEDEFIHVVSISFTALIITELLMVALTIRNFHWLMGVSIAFSVLMYVATLFFFKDYFGKSKSAVLRCIAARGHFPLVTNMMGMHM